jgi:hypothetical protein
LIEAAMANPAGESIGEVLRLDFDRRLMLQFRGGQFALPKSVESGNLSVNKIVIRWMSVKVHSHN